MSELEEFCDILPENWGDWVLESEIGQGSFGAVYKACNKNNGEICAIKIVEIPRKGQISQEAQQLARKGAGFLWSYYENIIGSYIRECELLKEMSDCPYIVKQYDYLVERTTKRVGFRIYMRMEYLESLPCFEETHEIGEKQALSMGIDLCRALEACEEKGILHRDIKPENILVTRESQFKLCDFGLAKSLDAGTLTVGMQGSFPYMPPEIHHGRKYDYSADVYSLGLVLYVLMNEGRLPFLPCREEKQLLAPKDIREAIVDRIRGEKALPPPSGASKAFAGVLLHACAYEQGKRYPNAREFRKDLEIVSCGGEPVLGGISTEPENAEGTSAPDRQGKGKVIEAVPRIDRREEKTESREGGEQPEATKRSAFRWIGVIALVGAAFAVIFFLSRGTGDEKKADAVEEASVATTTEVIGDDDNFAVDVTYNKQTGHRYAIYNYKDCGLLAKFDDWEQFCENQGGYLAVIENQEENDFLYEFLRRNSLTLAFFGYTDQHSEGSWIWVNWKSSSYTNWAAGQPNNGKTTKGKHAENYAQFFKDTADGTWNDAQIGMNTYHFICEWDY